MLKDETELWEILNKYYISKSSIKIQEENIQMTRSAKFSNGRFIEDDKPSVSKEGTIITKMNYNVQKHLVFSAYFSNFVSNLNRAIIFYPELLKISNAKSFFTVKNIFIFQTIQIQLITALVVYLTDLFSWISNYVIVNQLDPTILVKFLKEFNLKKKFVDLYSEKKGLHYNLRELLPDRIDNSYFQQKKK